MTVPVTVIIPTIPERGCGSGSGMLERAVASVAAQTLKPAGGVRVELDAQYEGPAVVRQRALDHRGEHEITTEWVGFLDDDDELLPDHFEQLWPLMQDPAVHAIYPWYRVIGGSDPMPYLYKRPYSIDNPSAFAIVMVVRTETARQVGFRTLGDLNQPGRFCSGEDWDFVQRLADWCVAHNQRPGIVHLPARTWLWHHHGGNTSGIPRNRLDWTDRSPSG